MPDESLSNELAAAAKLTWLAHRIACVAGLVVALVIAGFGFRGYANFQGEVARAKLTGDTYATPEAEQAALRRDDQRRSEGLAFGFGGLLVSAALGAAFIYFATGKYHPAVRQLGQRPQDIVWVHASKVKASATSTAYLPQMYLSLCTERGRTLRLVLPDESTTGILAKLEVALPHETFGFTNEHLDAFRSDPKRLRRAS
jgi:hypothetical protein